MSNMSLKEKIKQSKLNSAMKNWFGAAATFFTMAVACPNFASAQNVGENKDAETPKTEQLSQPINNDVDDVKKSTFEATVGFNNTSAIGVDKDGCYFYNDLVPSINISGENNGWYGNFNAAELLILNVDGNGCNFTPITSSFLLELGKEITYKNGNGAGKFSLILGRENVMAPDQIFNGVDLTSMSVEKNYMAAFGNGADRMVLSYKDSKGIKAELGVICNKGDGLLVIPNPKEADIWAKVGANVLANHNDMNLKVALAGRLGQQDELHGNVSFKDNKHKFGISTGVKHNFSKEEMAAYIAFNKDFRNGAELILQSLYKSNEVILTGAVSKDGWNIYTEVDFNTGKVENDKAVNNARVGVSYSFGNKIKLGENKR